MRRSKATSAGRGVSPTGRSKRGDRFVKLDFWILETDAYRSLPCSSRCLLVELLQRFNGANNGKIALSVRAAAVALNVTRNTAMDDFDRLVDRGFIRLKRDSSFHLKSRMAREWAVTIHGVGNQPATKDFARWKPALESKSRAQKKQQTGSKAATESTEPLPDGALVRACDDVLH